MPEAIGLFFIVSVLVPMSFALWALGWVLTQKLFHVKRGYLILVMAGAAIMAIGFIIGKPVVVWELAKSFAGKLPAIGQLVPRGTEQGAGSWLLGDARSVGAGLILLAASSKFFLATPDKQLLWFEERREKKRLHKYWSDNPPTVPERSTLIFGVPGSGKSAYIARMCYDISERDDKPFIVLVDGKGSCEKYSLYYSAKLIAERFGLKLRIINGTANHDLDGTVYDFLDGIDSADAAKDFIMTLIEDESVQESSGSEHYRILTEAYMTRVILFMMNHNIRVTLMNVIQMMQPDNFSAVCSQEDIADADMLEMQSYMKQNWKDVSASVTKLQMFIEGEGKYIFTSEGGSEVTNLRTAYAEGEMVLVLADELSMPKLSHALVKIAAMDLRALTSGRLTGTIDMDRPVYATFDEFSSYGGETIGLLMSLFAKCRSADVILTLATQSISSILGLGQGFYQSLVNTASRFVIFRQQGSESPEEAANLFNTQLHVTSTARTDDFMFSGQASNTIDEQYVLHPRLLRDLPSNYYFVIDKQSNQIIMSKNKFIS